jgi:3-(3-hydroxy-phenyl)propionate hydroxylase
MDDVSAIGARVLSDVQGRVAQRYDAAPGTAYLVRPDQHVCARWRMLEASDIEAALARALGVIERA